MKIVRVKIFSSSTVADENFLKLNLIPLSKNNIKYSMDQTNNSQETENGQ